MFVTALIVPFLVVVLQVLREPLPNGQYRRLTPKEATARIFADMFSPVIMLLLGGFALASALSKHHVAQWLAQIVLSRAGSSPHYVILANMLVSTLFSMFISNVAAPVLCFSLIAVSFCFAVVDVWCLFKDMVSCNRIRPPILTFHYQC